MIKLLVLFPLALVGLAVAAAIGGMVLLPMLALVPVLLAVGAVVLALVLSMSIFAIVLRVFAFAFVGAMGLLGGVLGLGFLVVGGALVLAIGISLFHLLLPILFIFGLIWLIRRASTPAPLQLTHNPG